MIADRRSRSALRVGYSTNSATLPSQPARAETASLGEQATLPPPIRTHSFNT